VWEARGATNIRQGKARREVPPPEGENRNAGKIMIDWSAFQ
jgi:hypothetical protein